jgi:dienelactone hydrolase
MSFVLDHVLAMDRERGNLLSHSIDEHRIGAAGLSLGGITTYLLVYGDCCRDDRIKAAEILDGAQPGVTVDGHVPLYLGHSDADPVLPYAGRGAPTTASGRRCGSSPTAPHAAVGGHRDALRPDRRTDYDRLLGRDVEAPRAFMN